MKATLQMLYAGIISCVMILFTAQAATAQVDPDDPFRGNYLLGQSSEIVVLSGGNGTATLRILDANGDITNGGISQVNSQSVAAPWGIHGTSEQVDLLTGDFNTDGFTDFLGVWPGPDSTVILYLPEMDSETFSWTSAAQLTVQSDGFPKLREVTTDGLKGWVRAVTGQFDDDTEPEIVVAYWSYNDDPAGDPIQIIVYDTDGTLVPSPRASISNRLMTAFTATAAENLREGNRFDIATGDFDWDGTDEIVLFSVEPGEESGGEFGWKLVGSIYDFEEDALVEVGSNTVTQGAGALFERSTNSNDIIERMSITTGDFDGDFKDDIAAGIFLGHKSASSGSINVYSFEVDSDLSTITGKDRQFFRSFNGSTGWPLSITGADVNLDGRDEIIHASQSSVRIYEPNEDLIIGSDKEFISLNTSDFSQLHRTVALTDVDIADSDSLFMEFVTVDNSTISVWQNRTDTDDFSIEGNSGEQTASVAGPGLAVAVGDFDGDAVRLGPPTRQTVTDITQPLVVLNAPPIHFDVIDGTIYDINECYDEDFRINCEHRSVYENASSTEMEVSTQVNSDWGVSKSLEAEVGVDFEFVSASVKGKLEREYGEGFSNVQGSSETITVKVTSDAIEDDRIYATVSNYDILEYPVYANNEHSGSVVAVVPKLKGLESLQNTWIGSKSGNARDYLSDHEVGNIFSYRETTNLPEGAVFFGNGGFEGGGGDTWELSGTSTQTWELRFSSQDITEREHSANQRVSRSLEGTVSAGFGPVSASLTATVSDTYGDEQISTHRTTVREESALIVEFGTVDVSILGTKTYTVSPYVYWSSQGALVLDYAVSPDVSAGVPSWWEENYSIPDLSMHLPWRYDEEKGIGSTNPELQREETRDIIFDPARPVQGEEVDIHARIQNYSLVDNFDPTTVKFYLGDPRTGGTLIQDRDGVSQFDIPRINSRESVVVSLEGWTVPGDADRDTRIYVSIDEGNSITEVHENNNIGWALVNPNFGTSTGIEDGNYSEAPNRIQLDQNYPNPFNPSTAITYHLSNAQDVTLRVYDILGRQVAELVNQHQTAGEHRVDFDASHLSSGMYLYRLSSESFSETKQMLLLK